MFLRDSDFKEFRDRHINNIIDCDNKLENLLIDHRVKDYIFRNDTYDNSLLRKIANSNSKKLRDYYFSLENVAFLIEKKKFWWIMDSTPFSINKIQLLYKEYILDGIKDCTRNITTYILDSNCDKTVIDKMLNYYMEDISSNNKAIERILASLDNEDYIFYVAKYKDNFEQYSKDNKESPFEILFGSYHGFEASFKIIKIFENVSEIKYSSILIKQIIDHLPFFESAKEEFLKYKSQLYEYLVSCNRYLLDCIDSLYFINSLLDNFGIEIIEKCFSYENILYLKEKGKLTFLLKSKVKLEDILKPHQLAIILDNSDLKEFHENIEILADKDINLISLLNSYFELNNLEACYKVLVYLSDQEQMEWFNNCDEKFLNLFKKSPIITKGFKKSLYNIYNDYISYDLQEFSIYELEKIISTSKDYSEKQLIDILTNKSNMEKLLQSKFFARYFINILNLNINIITKAYLSQSYQREIRNLKKLTDIFDGISYFNLKCNCEELYAIEDNLEEIGEKTSYEYQEILDLGYSLNNYRFDYKSFFWKIEELKDKNNIIKILDYFLSNSKYLKAFQLASKNLDLEFLSEYYKMRKDLITKQVNEGDLDLISNIFINLDKELLKREVTKDRERIIYSFTDNDLYRILVNKLDSNYQINEQELDINKFVSIFHGWNYYLVNGDFNSIIPNRELRTKIIKEVKNHRIIQEDIFKRLQDDYDELLIYLKLIRFSSFEEELDNKEKIFFNDLSNVLVRKNYEAALIFKTKYKDMDIERIKLQILEKIKRKSRMSILSSLTDLSKYEKEICVYRIGNKTFKIPTITFSGEAYNFLIRRVSNGEYFTNGKYKVKEESYSTIFEDNRSTYYGDTGIRLGYSNINPDDITYVYPFDAISNNFTKNKYYQQGLKCPTWLSADDLNRITKNNGSYNELRIKGPYFSDFVVSYDEPNDMTIEYADKNKNLLVKILRKSYPNSIEYNKDPYHNVQ